MTDHEELARLKVENAELRAIAQEVATGIIYEDDFGIHCIFCCCEENYITGLPEDFEHEPSCIVRSARAIIGQGGKP